MTDYLKKVQKTINCKICGNNLDYRNKLGFCKSCYNQYRPKMSKEAKLQYQYKWRDENIEKVKKSRKKTYEKNRERYVNITRKGQVKRKYGLSMEEYEIIAENQNYRCAICNKHKNNNKKGYNLAIDHSHITGEVRGLLCSKCNLALGGFEDNEELLLNALLYLKKYVSKTS